MEILEKLQKANYTKLDKIQKRDFECKFESCFPLSNVTKFSNSDDKSSNVFYYNLIV